MKKIRNVIIISALSLMIAIAGALNVSACEDERAKIDGYITEISEDYGICPELIMAMVETESNYQPDAKNDSCIGLMQVSDKWHTDRMERLGVTDLYDPYSNILVGVDFVAELADEYGDIGLVLMLYHGESKAFSNVQNGILSEYADGILSRSAELERLHGK